MITKTSDTKTKLTKTNSRRNSEKNAWTTAKVMGGVTWCQNHFEEKKLTNYIKMIGRLRLRWKKTQPSSKCLFSEVSREWFNWNLLISLPFTQTVELEMIEHDNLAKMFSNAAYISVKRSAWHIGRSTSINFRQGEQWKNIYICNI